MDGMPGDFTPVRFRLNKQRAVEAIDLLAKAWPGITQYYVCKIFFFADREHFLDWGTVISGDRYSALEHGPVPSRIYNLLKPGSNEEPDWLNYFYTRIRVEPEGNLLHLSSRGRNDLDSLSGTHREYLTRWIEKVRPLSFGTVADMAHEDEAWKRAWARPGNSIDMDLTCWISPDDPERPRMIEAMKEAGLFAY